MNKIIQEIQFISYMNSIPISKRKQKENIKLCNEFPSFLYDMINDKINDIYIYEFLYINYKRPNFHKQLYYRDPTKNYWGTALSLAIYKEKYTLAKLFIMLDDYLVNELIRLLFFIIEEVKTDNEKTKILGYLRIYTNILYFIDVKYLNQQYINGKYLLIQLFELNNHEYFNKFIEKKFIDFEIKYKGMTPLMWAIINKNSYYVKTLLELGANPFAIANTEIMNSIPYKYDYHILADIQLPFNCPRFPAPRNLNCIEIAEKYYEHLTEYNCIKKENDEMFAILHLFDIKYKITNYECGICYENYLSNKYKYKFSSCTHDCCYDCAVKLQKEYINDDSIDIINNLFDYELIIECPFCREKCIVTGNPLYITLYLCDIEGNHTGKSLEVIPCTTKLKDIVAMIYQDDTPFTLSGIRYYIITPSTISINNIIYVFDGKPNMLFNSYISNIGITNGTRILVSTEMYNYSSKLKTSRYKYIRDTSGKRIVFI